MEFIYNVQTRRYYSEEHDEYFYDEKEIYFEADDEQVVKALANILVSKTEKDLSDDEYKVCVGIVKNIIEDQDLKDVLAKEYKQELKDLFEDEALSQ